eukprot:6878897-Pyramimonas_sp.AAC.1
MHGWSACLMKSPSEPRSEWARGQGKTASSLLGGCSATSRLRETNCPGCCLTGRPRSRTRLATSCLPPWRW